ncbi:MAG: HAMP domain-containing protein [Myxococcota bacterium]
MNQPLAHTPAPAVDSGAHQRRLRNFLLDARFQLKFTSYVVGLTLVVAALLGVFIWRTTNTLFQETAVAVEARSRAAETSKELGNATLANEVLQHMEDPSFEKTLREKSAAIDRAYEAEKNAIIQARAQLVRRQQITLIALVGGFLAFVFFIGLACIVTTHKIVGPLFRMKRMANEVAAGRLHPPTYGLRLGDELKDVFDAFAAMVKALRQREEADLARVTAALELAERTKASADLVRELQTLQAEVKAKLE